MITKMSAIYHIVLIFSMFVIICTKYRSQMLSNSLATSDATS